VYKVQFVVIVLHVYASFVVLAVLITNLLGKRTLTWQAFTYSLIARPILVFFEVIGSMQCDILAFCVVRPCSTQKQSEGFWDMAIEQFVALTADCVRITVSYSITGYPEVVL